jgi:acid phosphatase
MPSGFVGTCQFPQITAGGLDDSYQHGKDLYGVYHDLLHFLPDDVTEAVSFRVTQNMITSQVAGMLINGMFKTQDNIQLLVEVRAFPYNYHCKRLV